VVSQQTTERRLDFLRRTGWFDGFGISDVVRCVSPDDLRKRRNLHDNDDNRARNTSDGKILVSVMLPTGDMNT
jgi:hypothetical protein